MTVMLIWLALAVLFLAYSNGANDNIKGVATLVGSGTTDYAHAIRWATVTTLAGSIAAIFVAQGLIEAFTGKGLVPDAYAAELPFLFAVAGGAALTVMVATLTGIPVSTTHALTGALVGAGLMLAGEINGARLRTAFFVPLAISPVLAILLTIALYNLFHHARLHLGVESRLCICIEGRDEVVGVDTNNTLMLLNSGSSISIADMKDCRRRYFVNGQTRFIGIEIQTIVDSLHYLSAGLVGFARGINDTPKIVALLLAAEIAQVSLSVSMVAVGLAIAAGGLLSAKKVAGTMSGRIVPMSHSQGFTANLVTALLVIVASRFGVPVSTTHVSVGSLFGLGIVTGEGHWRVMGGIVAAWFITLPLAALLAAAIAWLA